MPRLGSRVVGSAAQLLAGELGTPSDQATVSHFSVDGARFSHEVETFAHAATLVRGPQSVLLYTPDMSSDRIPLLTHPLSAPTAFTPEALVAAVRAERGLACEPVPPVCVLEFDGDLTDWLVTSGAARPWKPWACSQAWYGK